MHPTALQVLMETMQCNEVQFTIGRYGQENENALPLEATAKAQSFGAH